jgi:hypothetical protein
MSRRAVALWASAFLWACGGNEATVSQSTDTALNDELSTAPEGQPHLMPPPGQVQSTANASAPLTLAYTPGNGTCDEAHGKACPGWIMRGVNIYIIWYGDWLGASAPEAVIPDWAGSIGNEPWYNILTAYWDQWNNYVPSWVGYGGATHDWYSQGTNLSGSAVKKVVAAAISNGSLPLDEWGLYFVLPSSDVTHNNDSICKTACGWHTWFGFRKTFVKYAIVPDMRACTNVCGQSAGPNDPDADQMITVMSHELAESVSDPLITAWHQAPGVTETGDLCAWQFGNTFTLPSGATANMWAGDRYYLIQQLFHLDDSTGPSGPWSVTGHCAMQEDGSTGWPY